MICSICGKSQSKGYADYPLSEKFQDERICIGCHKKMQLIRDASNRESVAHEIESFQAFVESMQASDSASECIHEILSSLDQMAGTSYNQKIQISKGVKAKEIEILKSSMMLTTGYSFDGYRITKYLDVIFDEKLMGVGLFKGIASTIDAAVVSITGDEATVASKKLNEVKLEAKRSLISKAVDLGANAIIGIDYEGFSLGGIIAVAITGTAVVVRKMEDTENSIL